MIMKIIFDGRLRAPDNVLTSVTFATGTPALPLNSNEIIIHRQAARMGVLAMLGAFADAGYPVPLSVRVMRPFITHETQSAVVMKAGDDTGRMLYGPADFQVSANTQNKTIE